MAMADSTRPSEQDKDSDRKSKRREYQKQYYLRNNTAERRARKSAYDKSRYESNKEQIKATKAEYWKNNAEKLRAKQNAKYHANKRSRLKKMREYRLANAEVLKEKRKRKYWADADKYRRYSSVYAKKNREKVDSAIKQWRENNEDKCREYRRNYISKRFKADIDFRLKLIVAMRVRGALRKASAAKNARTLEFVGCSVAELRHWLEGKFLPGMDWGNYGINGWHIDHIIPLAKFDLSDPDQQAAAFHYTNLQPLWAKDNLRKGDSVAGQNLFGFAYAARIADAASAKPKRRRKHGGQHGDH
jgi:hypothetical protein